MPHLFNNIAVVTYEEIVPAFFSESALKVAIFRACKRGYGIKRIQRGGGKNRFMLIEYDSLPQDIMTCLPDPRKKAHLLEYYYKTDAEAIEFYSGYRFGDGTYLSDEYQEKYITNASMLNSLLQLRQDRIHEITTKGGVVKRLYATLLNDAKTFRPVLKNKFNVEHTLPECERRFKEMMLKYESESYISLISRKHLNSNAQKVDDDVMKLLNSMFATQHHKPTYRQVSEQYEAFLDGYITVINNETGEEYSVSGFKKLSEATIRTYLQSWENQIGNEKLRSGDNQKFMGKYKPHHSMNVPQFAGSVLSIDDRQPPFEYAPGKRVWFYLAMDVASGAIVNWVHGRTKEGLIHDFYRQLLRNYQKWGISMPAQLECEMSLNSQFKNSLLQDGIMFQIVKMLPNNARAKRIERAFGEMRYRIEKEHEGWKARPFAISESNQAGPAPETYLTYEAIVKQQLKDIETWNNSPHDTAAGMSKWDYFCTMQNKDCKPINWNVVLPMIGEKTVSSVRAGIVKLQGREFLLADNGEIALSEKLIRLMEMVEGQNVNLYWLDDDSGKMLKVLLHLNGKMICELLEKPKYNRSVIERTAEDEESMLIMNKYVSTIEGFMKRTSRSIDKVTIVDNRNKVLNNNFRIFDEIPDKETEIEIVQVDEEIDLVPVEINHTNRLIDRF